MKAFNKKKKPKNTTKNKIKLADFLDENLDMIETCIINVSYSIFTTSIISRNVFHEGIYNQSIYKLGKLKKSRTCFE